MTYSSTIQIRLREWQFLPADKQRGFLAYLMVKTIPLETLVELKLASGSTNPGRRRDLADVQDLIRVLGLDTTFAGRLDESVRGV